MTIEEIFDSVSDEDLELAIKEIHELDNTEDANVSSTIALFEIYSKLDEINTFHADLKYLQLSMLCTKEFSFRKVGLK